MTESYDPDELIACPFDPVHRVQRKRMPYHIVKCKKNFESAGIDFKTCPFNERHIVPRSEYSFHLEHCESKGRLAVQVKSNDDDRPKYVLKGNTDTPVTDWKPPDSSEDWEEELSTEQATIARDHLTYANEDTTHLPVPKPRLPYSAPTSALPRISPQLSGMLGRGRGRGIAQLPVVGAMHTTVANQHTTVANQSVLCDSPRVNSAVQDRMAPAVELNMANHVDESTKTNQEKDEKQKQCRKLTKMLKQIEKIEEEQKRGHKIDEDQIAKLKRKDDVLHKLAQLQL